MDLNHYVDSLMPLTMCDSSSLVPCNELVLYSPFSILNINVLTSPSNTLNAFVQLSDIPNIYTLPLNTHTMVTCSKAGGFKPKALVTITSLKCISQNQ